MPDIPEDIESRISELQNLAASEPTSDIFAELADLLRTSGNLNKARAICEQGLSIFKDDVECLLAYTRILMDSDDYYQAESVLQLLSSLTDEDVGILILTGQVYTQRNDYAGVHSIAEKLTARFPDDIRAKRFLSFLESKGLLKTENGEYNTESLSGAEAESQPVQETASTTQPAPKTTASTAKKPPAQRSATPQSQRIPSSIIPLEDLMHITAMLKGIVGVSHVVLLTTDNKTLASAGCPSTIARGTGLVLRSLKKALRVAFNALAFGGWSKGVIELNDATIHIMDVHGYLFALVCEPKTSLGALRITTHAIIKKHFLTGQFS